MADAKTSRYWLEKIIGAAFLLIVALAGWWASHIEGEVHELKDTQQEMMVKETRMETEMSHIRSILIDIKSSIASLDSKIDKITKP